MEFLFTILTTNIKGGRKHMTDFEKLQETFNKMGLPFTLSDDSEEYPLDEYDISEVKDTVVIINDEVDKFDFAFNIGFMFYKDGSFKEVLVF